MPSSPCSITRLAAEFEADPQGFLDRHPHPWIVQDDRVPRCFPLVPKDGTSVLILGRDRSSDVVVDDGSVSPLHAALSLLSDGRWTLSALTMEALTLHEDRALISGRDVLLEDGARVDLGDVRLWFVSSSGLARLWRSAAQPTAGQVSL